jgi:DNA polymerase-1
MEVFMEKLLILDSHSLMNRAFYAIPPLTNSEGLHTNAVFGFTNMLLKMKDEIKPDYIVATFDRKAPTFRHKEYEDYKAGRKRMPDELAEQFPLIKEMLELFAIDIFEIDGFEADDLIGTLSKFAEKQGIEVYIVTGDRDALQLASDNIKVIINKKGMTEKEIYDRNRMIEEFGVTPTQFIDVKGLMGDSSDNIPGVPGIGEKTAYKLIQTYGSVEKVLESIEEISGKKIKENLYEYREQAIFSKKLATIVTDVPIEIDLASIKSKEKYDVEGIRKLFFRLQFKSLLERIEKDAPVAAVKEEEKEAFHYFVAEDIKALEAVLVKLEENKLQNIFLNFKLGNSTDYSKLSLDSFVIKLKDYICYVDVEKLLKEDDQSTKALLKKLFEETDNNKICHDVKNAYTALSKLGIKLKNISFDTAIAAYLVDASKGEYELLSLIQEYLSIDIKEKEEDTQNIEFEVKKADKLEALYVFLTEKIKDFNMEELLYKVELPLCEVLSFMEERGFKVNREKLEELGKNFSFEIEKIQKEIYELAGEEFNISSPKQLGKILFEKLDLPVIKKTKTGYSTNAEVLEQLTDKHPIIEKIGYYRQLTKLHSTYIEGLKNVIGEDGKIHSNLNQTVTTTGRLSSTEPNLQNIPIKYEMGRAIRRVFEPDNEESVILSADYSQIELRVLAHIADDENLISAFKNHSDIHTKTASEVFKVPLDEVTSIMRSRAKAVNFGIVYGISDFSLAKDLKIPKSEAKMYMDNYFERYPNVKKYMHDIIAQAKEKGYVDTVLNRRRYIPEIKASNKIVQSLGERLAMNAPIQGSAADVIKIAMVKVYDRLIKEKLKSSLILQVHDELILNVYKDEIDIIKNLVKEEMEKVLELSVPLEVDINIGDTWYDAK